MQAVGRKDGKRARRQGRWKRGRGKWRELGEQQRCDGDRKGKKWVKDVQVMDGERVEEHGDKRNVIKNSPAKTKEMSSPKTAKIRVFVKWRYRESFTRLRLIRRVLVVWTKDINIHQQMEASRTASGILAINCWRPGSDFGCKKSYPSARKYKSNFQICKSDESVRKQDELQGNVRKHTLS